MKQNVWELSKLLDAADREVRRGGLDPRFHARGILECWRKAQPVHWAQLAVLAAVRPPSEVTKCLFLEALEHRAGVLQ